MKPKRKVRWMVIAAGKKSGCRCEYTGSILINTPIYMVSDRRHSTLVFAEAELLVPLTHSFSPEKEQHTGGYLCLSRAGLFKHTWLCICAGAPEDMLLMKAPNSPHGTGQAHNSSTSRLGF